jgi:hypothetical protein
MVMSNSPAVDWKESQNARRPHFEGAAFSKNVADFIYSALSSDTARPIIVERATTESCAEVGPGECHDAAIPPNGRHCQGRTAFSSEVGTGSRKENASN